MVRDCTLLGKFLLQIPPQPRGVPQIEVTFDIDADGILKVHAIEKSTETEAKVKITGQDAKFRLSKDEVERIIAKEEQRAQERAADARSAAARNDLEAYAYASRNAAVNSDPLRSKIGAADKAEVEQTAMAQLSREEKFSKVPKDEIFIFFDLTNSEINVSKNSSINEEEKFLEKPKF